MTLLSRVDAPPSWRRIAFISDLHLGADTPRTQAQLLAWWADCAADALFILGDLFEAWVGDDALSLPYAAALRAALARDGRPVYFQHGNRDFLLGSAFGWSLLAEHCLLRAFGAEVLLVHGDAQCLDDAAYQSFRAQVRGTAWQEAFLQRPLSERLQLAAQMRDASQRTQSAQRHAGLPFAEPDTSACLTILRESSCSLLVHGHTHRPGCFDLGDGRQRLVLSDWDFEAAEEPRGDCLIWSAEGWQRRAVWG